MLPATFLLTAWMMGSVSSLHCVGMCGPLIISSPWLQRVGNSKWAGWTVYHGGRLTTYLLIGVLLGIVGRRISLAGWQQGFSIALGILFILSFSCAVKNCHRLGYPCCQPCNRASIVLLVKTYGNRDCQPFGG